ncbi:embryonic protein UVS.2-like isoform 4-T4 [Anomaloglossus baeobatrachus]
MATKPILRCKLWLPRKRGSQCQAGGQRSDASQRRYLHRHFIFQPRKLPVYVTRRHRCREEQERCDLPRKILPMAEGNQWSGPCAVHPVRQLRCWSYVGHVGGAQDLSLMNPGCLHRGIIQHELLHSLGFQHEQCRSDRDKYIRINWGNISQDKERNFYKMSTQNLGVPYDYLSVLHYGKFAFATDTGKPTLEPTGDPQALIGQRVGLSSLDVAKINKLYECNLCSRLLPDAHGTFSWESKKNPNLTAACVWLIRVPEDKVFLQFESFIIRPSPDCAQASVTVYDGISTASPILINQSCGNVAPLAQISSGRFMKIEVTGSGIGSSFKAMYSAIKCGGSLISTTGNFSTPHFPSKYPNSVNCVWVLSAPAGNKITLQVAPFTLEPSPGCSYDYFLLRDGRRQVKKCGQLPRMDFSSSSHSLMVHFHSDSSVQASGFLATYSFSSSSPRPKNDRP